MNLRFLPFLALATALIAQGPGGPRSMHRMGIAKTDQVKSYLNLTDAQVTSLQQLRESEMTALKPVFEQMGTLRQSLHTQIQGTSSDATAAGKLLVSMQSLQQQVTTTRANFQQQALGVLTADQKTKLAALETAASLMSAVHEATALNLLAPAKGAGGGPGGPALEVFEHPFGGPPQ